MTSKCSCDLIFIITLLSFISVGDEDRIPPTISFKDALTVSAYEEEDGLTRIDSPAFASLEAARQYLRSILIAEDDCAKDLDIDVASPPVAACAATVFTVTITDPRCSGTNSIQTVVKRYALWVDSVPPTVSIVLERGPPQSNRLYSDPDGQYVHIDEGLYDFEDTEFSYFVNVSVTFSSDIYIQLHYAHIIISSIKG